MSIHLFCIHSCTYNQKTLQGFVSNNDEVCRTFIYKVVYVGFREMSQYVSINNAYKQQWRSDWSKRICFELSVFSHHQENKIPGNNKICSLVRWFPNNFQSWLRHTWTLLANHPTQNQKHHYSRKCIHDSICILVIASYIISSYIISSYIISHVLNHYIVYIMISYHTIWGGTE